MKKILILLLLAGGNAQAQQFLDSIAAQACNCIKELDVASLTKENKETKLGLCIVNAAMPYKEQLKASNGLDLDHLDHDTGLKLGQLVVGKLMLVCPETLVDVGKKLTKPSPNQRTGLLQEIKENEFVTITVIGNDQTVSKFIWLKDFSGSDELLAIKKPKGQKVTVTYEINEYYDPKIKGYRSYNVISSLVLEAR